MKIALVHDYLSEFGGAERVLLALSELYPDAPIYTSFYQKGSPAWERFRDKDVRVSWVHWVPFFASKLHSPLRFLAPLIWNSLDLREYDVVIGSASWYVTKGFKRIRLANGKQKGGKKKSGKQKKTVEICYCHTPPRWLYGYRTSIEWQKHKLVRMYGQLVGFFMRLYDFQAAQRVDHFIANSNNVALRIAKYYRRDSKVIYPPVDELPLSDKKRDDYYLIVSRLVGGKGLEMAVEAALLQGLRLKIVGKPAGYSSAYRKLEEQAAASKGKIELVGYVPDEDLADLYARAKAFLVLAKDEDFGITPVEAMMTGTPVIAYRGGGYLETVVDGKTGVFFDDYRVFDLVKAIKRFEKIKFDPNKIHKHAMKFSKERFLEEVREFVAKFG